MSDINFQPGAEEDLPRTIRRARQERDGVLSAAAHEPVVPLNGPHIAAGATAAVAGADHAPPLHMAGHDQKPHVVVRELNIGFFHLMFFFIKAVLAAIPALVILGALVWLGGEILTQTFPELLKMKILIQFPN